jgi:nucleoside-diphosphate-sugar epimerase
LKRFAFSGVIMQRNLAERVLVTGGSGFLGSHLCERLLADGAEVLCVDNFFTGTDTAIVERLRVNRRTGRKEKTAPVLRSVAAFDSTHTDPPEGRR